MSGKAFRQYLEQGADAADWKAKYDVSEAKLKEKEVTILLLKEREKNIPAVVAAAEAATKRAAEEKKARIAAEKCVEKLREELDTLRAELSALRDEVHTRTAAGQPQAANIAAQPPQLVQRQSGSAGVLQPQQQQPGASEWLAGPAAQLERIASAGPSVPGDIRKRAVVITNDVQAAGQHAACETAAGATGKSRKRQKLEQREVTSPSKATPAVPVRPSPPAAAVGTKKAGTAKPPRAVVATTSATAGPPTTGRRPPAAAAGSCFTGSQPSPSEFMTLNATPMAAWASIAGAMQKFGVPTGNLGHITAARGGGGAMGQDAVDARLRRLGCVLSTGSPPPEGEAGGGRGGRDVPTDEPPPSPEDMGAELAAGVQAREITWIRLLNAFQDAVLRCADAVFIEAPDLGMGVVLGADGAAGNVAIDDDTPRFACHWHRPDYRGGTLEALVRCVRAVDAQLRTGDDVAQPHESLSEALWVRLHRLVLIAVLQERPRYTETEVCAAATTVGFLAALGHDVALLEALLLDLMLVKPHAAEDALPAIAAAVEVAPSCIASMSAASEGDRDGDERSKADIVLGLLRHVCMHVIDDQDDQHGGGHSDGPQHLVTNGGVSGRLVAPSHPRTAALFLLKTGERHWGWGGEGAGRLTKKAADADWRRLIESSTGV